MYRPMTYLGYYFLSPISLCFWVRVFVLEGEGGGCVVHMPRGPMSHNPSMHLVSAEAELLTVVRPHAHLPPFTLPVHYIGLLPSPPTRPISQTHT